MCKGLAVIAEKIDGIWKVHAQEGINSHDTLISKLRDGLKFGTDPHLKFEIYFPMIVNDDIIQDVAEKYYPEGWVEKHLGKWVACAESFAAVSKYLSENPNLINFDQYLNLLDNASLNRASLNRASLNRASLNRASLDGASLNDASLNDASLDGASLDGASLDGASLNDASLDGASLNDVSLDGASLNRASLDGASLDEIGRAHV